MDDDDFLSYEEDMDRMLDDELEVRNFNKLKHT
jgi:hypothetical protein